MVKRHIKLRQLIFMALCCVMGLFAKGFISPATNLLTDFLRMPGGGTAAGLSLSFLILGASLSRWRYSGTLMGFVQGLLAFALGMSGRQGVLAPITYAVPGIVIDLISLLSWKDRATPAFFVTAGGLASGANAAISNILVFHFTGFLFLTWIMLALCSGILGGFVAWLAYKKLHAFMGQSYEVHHGDCP